MKRAKMASFSPLWMDRALAGCQLKFRVLALSAARATFGWPRCPVEPATVDRSLYLGDEFAGDGLDRRGAPAPPRHAEDDRTAEPHFRTTASRSAVRNGQPVESDTG